MLTYNNPQQPVVSTSVQVTQDTTANESIFGKEDASEFIKTQLLRYKLEQAIKLNNGQSVTTGASLLDMQTDRFILNHGQNTQQFAASVNKIPVALLVLQDLRAGTLNMNQMMTWLPSDVRGGSGVYDQPGAPTQAKLSDVLFDMLNHSGNTVVRVLVNYGLGGAQAVNDRWAQMPQLNDTRLQPLDANRFYLGNSTPHDSLWAMQKLLAKNDSHQNFIKNALATNIFTDISVRSQLAGNDYIVLANKVGLLDDTDGNNRHDVGIIYNTTTRKSYAYSFMTTTAYENTPGTQRAEQSLKDMGRYTLRFAGDKVQETTTPKSDVAPKSTRTEGRILY